ncbi:MAG: cyclophilin-like fold protein [Nitrospinota bacterium]
MSTPIEITAGHVTLKGELFDTETAKAIIKALPFNVPFNTWGDEFYFEIPIEKTYLDDTATSGLKVGDIGYWPTGNAMCLFFGRTPMSTNDEPVPASDVNIIGRITGNPYILKEVMSAKDISIKRDGG